MTDLAKQNPLAADLDHILARTGDLWEELRNARLFITGGTGFFGMWLLESFVRANDALNLNAQAVVLTRNAARLQQQAPHLATHPAIRVHSGDIRDFVFPAGSFSHIIHAATESSSNLNGREPAEMLDGIVNGTRRVLDFAVSCGAGRFLLTSSGTVYGPQPPEITHLPETYSGGPDHTNPRSAYAEGKRVAELLCSIYHQRYGLASIIARGFAFVGPNLPLDVHFAIGNFIGDCLHGRAIEIRGDGTPYRSFLYAADLAIWLWTILLRGEPCRAYNVGSEHSLSIAETAATVARVMQSPHGVRIARPATGRPPERYIPDTSRARRELRLEQWISLEAAIRRTAAWHRRAVKTPHSQEVYAC
jgi:nucleoside-diphosphate-sugar epimerase